MSVPLRGYLQTGQFTCHDAAGREIKCEGTGQDAESRRGVPWPAPRFDVQGDTVVDRLTGLAWLRDANVAEFPLTWQEARDHMVQMNRDQVAGHSDWRLPNRRELRSLICHQNKRPALPSEHPFINLFQGWYWSSTTAAISPAHAWYVSMDGGRMFYGGKDQSFMVWPVRGAGNGVLPATGQTGCYNDKGAPVPCTGTGQDGELVLGCPLPSPRFELSADVVIDRLTHLHWRREADLTGAVSWEQALAAIARLNDQAGEPDDWRLPNINELESLVDCSASDPALSKAHPFMAVQDVYWSSSTSLFEPDWAWALYMSKGAIGVGQKQHARFYVWAVHD